MILNYKFTDLIPEDVPFGWLFISIKYKTAVHKCICGCGNEVVTPISPNDWKLTFDGSSVSLKPSIGNWNFDCRSHYWIVKNEVINAAPWSDRAIKSGRERDVRRKASFFKSRNSRRSARRKGHRK